MARLHRQDLKTDQFSESVDSVVLFLEEHGRRLALMAVVVVLGVGSVIGYRWYSRQQEQKASAALGQAIMTFTARVQAGLPPLPGETGEEIFPSAEEKWRAAEEKFAAIREEYPGTQGAWLARHYEGVCKLRLGQTEAGIAALEEVGRAGNPEIASLAQFHLAGFYRKEGREEEAEKLYRQLSEKPTLTVPKATTLFALAELLTEKDPGEARRLYEQVKEEFPNTPAAEEVDRRLESWPAPAES